MDEVRDAYGVLSSRYIELFDTIDAVEKEDREFLERHLAGLSGPVLDVGCGPGRLTAHLRSLGVEVSGIDLVPEFIDHARSAHPAVPFDVGSMERLPFADGSIAGILSWYSLIHTPPNQLDAVLVELRRVMRSGGRLVVGFFDSEDLLAFPHKVVTAYSWPVDELSDHLEAAGFIETERLRHPAVPEQQVRAHATLATVAP